MKHILLVLGLSLSSLLSAATQPQLIPLPSSMEVKQGSLTLNARIDTHCPAEFLPHLTTGLPAFELTSVSASDATLEVNKDSTLPREGYTLDTADGKVVITAASGSGVYYATQTLLQLMPASVMQPGAKPSGIEIPAVTIKDKPRFGWRGLMLDSSRHFQTIPEIKRFIDRLAHYKLNVFHWHLTDGHGWRFESKKYPKLTSVGAWRTQPGYPHKGRTETYGGYYTQEEMRDIVAYAKLRGVTVVPEIDMPGHCFAFVAAYPEVGCLREPQEVAPFYTYPADAQRFPPITGTDVLCVSQEKTLTMCRDILDEVMEIFPSNFVHIGGDEVQKKWWKNCEDCQSFITDNGIEHAEHGLQSWFIQQLDNYLVSKNKRLIGWDEILEGGLAKNATVMSWTGEKGGIKAAQMGHDVVMSPQTYIYLDHGQSHSPLEPPHWPGHKPLDRAYGYDPIPESLTPEQARHILGIQGNVWTIFTHEEWLIDICTWPRACAIAETGWSPKAKKNWDSFYARLANSHRARLDAMGINYWWETSLHLASWSPEMLKPNEEHVTLEFDITEAVSDLPAGKHDVVFAYTRGPQGLSILSAELLENGKIISQKTHKGFSGGRKENNIYSLEFPELKPNAKYTLRTTCYGDGGGNSHGIISISSVETKILKTLPWQDGYVLDD